jgi:hypothetical protein
MNEALAFILYEQRRWDFDLEHTYIMFEKDNTGVVCKFRIASHR